MAKAKATTILPKTTRFECHAYDPVKCNNCDQRYDRDKYKACPYCGTVN